MTYIQINQSRKKKLFLLASHKTITLTVLLLHLIILIMPNKKEHTIKNKKQNTVWIQKLRKGIHLTDMHRTQKGVTFTCQGDLKRILESLEEMTLEANACFITTHIHQNANHKLVWEGKYRTT